MKKIILSISICLLFTTPLQALTIDFTGTISGISRNNIGLPIANGGLFSGEIYVETTVLDKNPSLHTAEYLDFITSYITVNVEDYSYSQPINNVTIYNNKPVHTYFLDRFFVNAGNIGGTGGLQLWIDSQYSNPPPTFLNSTTLIAPDLNLSYYSTFVIRNPDIDFYGIFTSFAPTLTPTPIPEPSTLLLTGLGLLGFIRTKKHKRA